jgi:hypothetical protein
MSLLCPPGAPTGAHSLIYQAKPIGRPARKATADFSKIKIIFWGSPCTKFPKVSQTTNESASVVVKHHPVFPPSGRQRFTTIFNAEIAGSQIVGNYVQNMWLAAGCWILSGWACILQLIAASSDSECLLSIVY